MTVDRFGLQREGKIVKSGVRDVFTPHKPVDEIELLFGRNDEVARIIAQINTPGQHCLLYGERGVGKSSLANVLAPLVAPGGNLFAKRCDSADTFETIIELPLREVGIELGLEQRVETFERKRKFGASVKAASYERGKGSGYAETFRSPDEVSPSAAAAELTATKGLLLIDEADAISDPDDRKRLAEFIKQLSDAGASLKLLVVGIGSTATDLTAGHPSVSRCLAETKLRRLSNDELREIVTGGSQRVGLTITDGAIDTIVGCSAGYPHFTHLLTLKCAENAIADTKTKIDKDDVVAAMEAARADAEGSLKDAYDSACRSYGTDMYRVVLMAAAQLDSSEFTAEQLRGSIESITGTPISQGALNNHFQRLVADDGSTVLRRMAKGVYRFTDPRMPSYVRIANQMVP